MIRFGLHDFLNAQPLLVPLLRRQKELGLEIVRDVPSVLAEKLKAGTLDLAMIPTIEYLKEAARYRLVPGVCIASRDKVGTVTKAQILEIVETKKADFNVSDPEIASRIIAGTARSMGIEVEG